MTELFKQCSDQWKDTKKDNIPEAFKLLFNCVRFEGEDMRRKYTGLFETSDSTVTDKFQKSREFFGFSLRCSRNIRSYLM